MNENDHNTQINVLQCQAYSRVQFCLFIVLDPYIVITTNHVYTDDVRVPSFCLGMLRERIIDFCLWLYRSKIFHLCRELKQLQVSATHFDLCKTLTSVMGPTMFNVMSTRPVTFTFNDRSLAKDQSTALVGCSTWIHNQLSTITQDYLQFNVIAKVALGRCIFKKCLKTKS